MKSRLEYGRLEDTSERPELGAERAHNKHTLLRRSPAHSSSRSTSCTTNNPPNFSFYNSPTVTGARPRAHLALMQNLDLMSPKPSWFRAWAREPQPCAALCRGFAAPRSYAATHSSKRLRPKQAMDYWSLKKIEEKIQEPQIEVVHANSDTGFMPEYILTISGNDGEDRTDPVLKPPSGQSYRFFRHELLQKIEGTVETARDFDDRTVDTDAQPFDSYPKPTRSE